MPKATFKDGIFSVTVFCPLYRSKVELIVRADGSVFFPFRLGKPVCLGEI